MVYTIVGGTVSIFECGVGSREKKFARVSTGRRVGISQENKDRSIKERKIIHEL